MDTTQVVDTESGNGITLGERLARVREAAGLTQSALAALLDTRQSYISMIETGTRKPSRDLINRWVAACGRRLDLVFSRPDGAPIAEVSHYLDTMPPEHAVMVTQLVRLLALADESTREILGRTLQGLIEMNQGKDRRG